MVWTPVDEVDTELCIRSYKGTFKTKITDDTMYFYISRGNTHFRESDMCLFLTYLLCKRNKNSGSVVYYCPPVHTPLPCELRGLNVLGSERAHNIYWHLLVQGLTFQALFVVLKCHLTFLPQCPVMPFLICMF